MSTTSPASDAGTTTNAAATSNGNASTVKPTVISNGRLGVNAFLDPTKGWSFQLWRKYERAGTTEYTRMTMFQTDLAVMANLLNRMLDHTVTIRNGDDG